MKNKSGFQLKELIIVVVITSILTSLTTGVIMYNNNRITNHVSGSDLNQDENLKEFLKVYASLIGDYYTDFDKKAMLEEAMKAMFNYLGEDYSDYLNKDETDSLASKLNGTYKGIGVQIIDQNIIYKVFADSPAMEVGIQVGDQIVSINGEETTNKTSDEVAALIQNANGDKIILGVLRDGSPIQFEIEVKTLFVPAISYQLVDYNDKKIGYLAISTFSNTVSAQVKGALKDLESQGMNSLVIDLRNNTGGYLAQASEIANMFLEEGKVIYSLAEKDETEAYVDDTSEKRDYPVAIIMNEGTASASEILAAALKDSYHNNVTLVGETSYGKGKVQQTKNLEDGSMVKYTTARWLRPNGDCIDGVGIHPDVLVEIVMPNEGEEVIDTQLKEALQILSNM
ncbi:MAG: S41 family peptidase [Bacilli bacterium]|nr:S41 family peptidase [Bacilli bacterium]